MIPGQVLPNPRHVSNIVHQEAKSAPRLTHNLWFMQFGQFLAHDIVLTPMIREKDGYLANCKSCSADPDKCHPIPGKHPERNSV